MLELLYASGMRVSELVSLNLDDIMRDGYIRCFGKGHKERMIPIHRRAATILDQYTQDARPRLVREHRPQVVNSGENATWALRVWW